LEVVAGQGHQVIWETKASQDLMGIQANLGHLGFREFLATQVLQAYLAKMG
jgi:hypothetical protein